MSCAVTVYLFAPVVETPLAARIRLAWTGMLSAVSASSASTIGCARLGGKRTILFADLNPGFTATSKYTPGFAAAILNRPAWSVIACAIAAPSRLRSSSFTCTSGRPSASLTTPDICCIPAKHAGAKPNASDNASVSASHIGVAMGHALPPRWRVS